jgi:hypothetical protein
MAVESQNSEAASSLLNFFLPLARLHSSVINRPHVLASICCLVTAPFS